jgi:hypothetical protein
MRVNVYAEEITDRIDIIEKVVNGVSYTGLRFYLELPVTIANAQGTGMASYRGPFMHHDGDDDSAAVTFWGKKDLRGAFLKAIEMLERHAAEHRSKSPPVATRESTQAQRFDESFRKRLEQACDDRFGLFFKQRSRNFIAHAVGQDFATVTDWFEGQLPEAAELTRLALVLKVDPDWLLLGPRPGVHEFSP